LLLGTTEQIWCGKSVDDYATTQRERNNAKHGGGIDKHGPVRRQNQLAERIQTDPAVNYDRYPVQFLILLSRLGFQCQLQQEVQLHSGIASLQALPRDAVPGCKSRSGSAAACLADR